MTSSAEINRKYFDYVTSLKRNLIYFRIVRASLVLFRVILFPLVIFYSVILSLFLGTARRFFYSSKIGPFYFKAAEAVEEFGEQYPFHYYPLIAKAMGLIFMREWLAGVSDEKKHIVEFAAGDGTFSEHIFRGTSHKVTGMDINPYSLGKCSRYPHFKKLIVGDNLDPPFPKASIDTILAMHFLHHVSAKEETLRRWSSIGNEVVFNESTPYWISASVPSYLLRKIGLRKAAEKVEGYFLSSEMQSLESASALDSLVNRCFDIKKRISYLSETVFFLCNFSSLFMIGIYGPPTPGIIKRLSIKPLRYLSLRAAKELIYLDAVSDRRKDTFIFYYCQSRQEGKREIFSYACPDCGIRLKTNEEVCPKENTRFPVKNGLLFLLPKEMSGIYESFDTKTSSLVSGEHL